MIATEVQTEYPPCPNGCPPGDDHLFAANDRLNGLPGEFSVVRCRNCRLARTAPRPTAASMGFYYPASYSPYETSEVPRVAALPERGLLYRVLRTLAGRVVRLNTQPIPELPAGRMLEIGCASGSYLSHMSKQGWKVRGIEFSEHAASNARAQGFEVQTGAIETAEETGPFDLIVGWMVLEHLHAPTAALSKLATWTVPGGWLVVSTPNAGSLDFRLFRNSSYALQVPTHLFHFDPASLSRLLENNGWTVKRVLHQRVLGNYLGSIGLALENVGAPRAWCEFFKNLPARRGYLNHVLYPLAWLLSLFGQTGRMTIWAQRKTEEGRP